MGIVYIVVVLFVTALLLSPVIFPFWKVWIGVQKNHPDFWNKKGPFRLLSLLAMTGLGGAFLEMVEEIAKDDVWKKGDPALHKSAHFAHEIIKMAPKTFMQQIIYVLIFIFFAMFFTTLLIDVAT